MEIVKIDRHTYRIILSTTELMTICALLTTLRMGFINWLQRKGKRTQDQQVHYITEADKILTAFRHASEI